MDPRHSLNVLISYHKHRNSLLMKRSVYVSCIIRYIVIHVCSHYDDEIDFVPGKLIRRRRKSAPGSVLNKTTWLALRTMTWERLTWKRVMLKVSDDVVMMFRHQWRGFYVVDNDARSHTEETSSDVSGWMTWYVHFYSFKLISESNCFQWRNQRFKQWNNTSTWWALIGWEQD